MTRPTRDTPAGRADLDLQNQGRREGRGTQELLTLYVVERWLARMSGSRYAGRFVLEGGMLLAAFGARRPAVDADTLVRRIDNDVDTVTRVVAEIAGRRSEDDGVEFLPQTARALVADVVAFADPLAAENGHLSWAASTRRWESSPTA